MTRDRRHRSGFTLLEVLIALAILSMAIVVSIQGFASGLRLLKLSGEHQEAMLIADLKAREITSPTQAGRDSGTEGAFHVGARGQAGRHARPRRGRPRAEMASVGSRRARELGRSPPGHGGTLRTVAGDGDNKATNPKP